MSYKILRGERCGLAGGMDYVFQVFFLKSLDVVVLLMDILS